MNKDIVKNCFIASLVSASFTTLFFIITMSVICFGWSSMGEEIKLFIAIFTYGVISNFVCLFIFHRKVHNISLDNSVVKIIGFVITFVIIAIPLFSEYLQDNISIYAMLGYSIIASTFLASISYVLFVKDKD